MNAVRKKYVEDNKLPVDSKKWTEKQKEDYFAYLEKQNLELMVYMFDSSVIFKTVIETILHIKENIAKTSGNHPLLKGILNDLNGIGDAIKKREVAVDKKRRFRMAYCTKHSQSYDTTKGETCYQCDEEKELEAKEKEEAEEKSTDEELDLMK